MSLLTNIISLCHLSLTPHPRWWCRLIVLVIVHLTNTILLGLLSLTEPKILKTQVFSSSLSSNSSSVAPTGGGTSSWSVSWRSQGEQWQPAMESAIITHLPRHPPPPSRASPPPPTGGTWRRWGRAWGRRRPCWLTNWMEQKSLQSGNLLLVNTTNTTNYTTNKHLQLFSLNF